MGVPAGRVASQQPVGSSASGGHSASSQHCGRLPSSARGMLRLAGGPGPPGSGWSWRRLVATCGLGALPPVHRPGLADLGDGKLAQVRRRAAGALTCPARPTRRLRSSLRTSPAPVATSRCGTPRQGCWPSRCGRPGLPGKDRPPLRRPTTVGRTAASPRRTRRARSPGRR